MTGSKHFSRCSYEKVLTWEVHIQPFKLETLLICYFFKIRKTQKLGGAQWYIMMGHGQTKHLGMYMRVQIIFWHTILFDAQMTTAIITWFNSFNCALSMLGNSKQWNFREGIKCRWKRRPTTREKPDFPTSI